MSAVVIIAGIGKPESRKAIESVLNQTYPTTCYVVCDGEQYYGRAKVIADDYRGNPNFKVCFLPVNVGANGFYGHRTYAAFSHLVNEDYVSFLDEDCWLNNDHIESCVNNIISNNYDWSYSLRNITDKEGNFLCRDNCESLGKWISWTNDILIDTNCYCIKREVLIQLAHIWNGGWGRDRVFPKLMLQHFPKVGCTGNYSSNYRLSGNEGSVTSDFFEKGNQVMMDLYKGNLPWATK
jgi:glycosyltransferase involved in cell wall biosynthesis